MQHQLLLDGIRNVALLLLTIYLLSALCSFVQHYIMQTVTQRTARRLRGDIVEQGNHEELLAKNRFYAELYNSQFEQAS